MRATTLSLPEQIAEQVGRAVIRGEIKSGSRIQEQELADRFEVSRGPVREALRILEQHGLVQITARKGAQITKLSKEEVRQIFDVRANLVGLAALEATALQSPDFIRQIGNAAEHMSNIARTSDNLDDYVGASYQLNILMVEASRNKFLKGIILSLAHQTMRYTRLGLSSKKRRVQSAENYRKLAKAVADNNPELARQIAETLVRNSRDEAMALLEREGESD